MEEVEGWREGITIQNLKSKIPGRARGDGEIRRDLGL